MLFSITERSQFGPLGLSWLSPNAVASPADLDVADWTSWCPSLRDGRVQAECLGCAVLACGPWGQCGFEQVGRIWELNWAETQGAHC